VGPEVRPLPAEPTPPRAVRRHRRSAQGRARRTRAAQTRRLPGARGRLFSFDRSRRLITQARWPRLFGGRRQSGPAADAQGSVVCHFSHNAGQCDPIRWVCHPLVPSVLAALPLKARRHRRRRHGSSQIEAPVHPSWTFLGPRASSVCCSGERPAWHSIVPTEDRPD
jgi:hypothetical protein